MPAKITGYTVGICYSYVLHLIELCATSIEHFHVMLSPSRLRRKTENSRHVGVQRDRSFCGDLHEMSDIPIKPFQLVFLFLVLCPHQ